MSGILSLFFFNYAATTEINTLTTSFPTRRSSDLAKLDRVVGVRHADARFAHVADEGAGDADRAHSAEVVDGEAGEIGFHLAGVAGVEDRKSTRLNSSH